MEPSPPISDPAPDASPPRPDAKPADRLAAFSDALFAFSMTLFAIEVRVPSGVPIVTDADLAAALSALMPALTAWGLCFFCVGLTWIAHHRMFRFIERADGRLIALNLTLLFLVSAAPFGASLVISYGSLHLAWPIFGGLMALMGLSLVAIWAHARGPAGLVTKAVSADVARYIALRSWVFTGVFGVSALVAFASPQAAEFVPLLIFPILAGLRRTPGAAGLRALG